MGKLSVDKEGCREIEKNTRKHKLSVETTKMLELLRHIKQEMQADNINGMPHRYLLSQWFSVESKVAKAWCKSMQMPSYWMRKKNQRMHGAEEVKCIASKSGMAICLELVNGKPGLS